MDLQALRQKCLEQSRKAVAESVGEDDFIAQSIANIEELEKTCNSLSMRIREWYSLHFPEINRREKDNEAFLKKISGSSKEDMMEELKINLTAGADLSEEDLVPIMEYAYSALQLYELKEKITEYLGKVMEKHCRNINAITGPVIGAKLISEAGSLQQMSEMTSTHIQMLGAEKALFRHLRTGAKPPRHGHIFAHPLIQKARDKNRGKVARALANKIAIAARTDYFGEKFIGEELRKELDERFG